MKLCIMSRPPKMPPSAITSDQQEVSHLDFSEQIGHIFVHLHHTLRESLTDCTRATSNCCVISRCMGWKGIKILNFNQRPLPWRHGEYVAIIRSFAMKQEVAPNQDVGRSSALQVYLIQGQFTIPDSRHETGKVVLIEGTWSDRTQNCQEW